MSIDMEGITEKWKSRLAEYLMGYRLIITEL